MFLKVVPVMYPVKGCLLTADGTDDDLVKPEGIADYAVPRCLRNECLSESGSVAWSKTTETQNEMVVVLQLNKGITNCYLWPSRPQGVS